MKTLSQQHRQELQQRGYRFSTSVFIPTASSNGVPSSTAEATSGAGGGNKPVPSTTANKEEKDSGKENKPPARATAQRGGKAKKNFDREVEGSPEL